MNILVTGANGQLGSEIRLLAAGSADRFVFTDVEELDITDRETVLNFVKQEKIDVLINCAAYTNVDAAEDNPGLAELLNATAVGYLAEAMACVGGLLVHISTDYVFGKEVYNTPCTEEMKGTPTGVYGLTKLHGEQAVMASGCRYVIIRTAWLYSEFGRNFVKTMLGLTEARPEVRVVFDQVGTPTYALDLAMAILQIIPSAVASPELCGIYNYSNEGVCSWYDFAYEIARLSGHFSSKVLPCHSVEFVSKVHRPAYSVLDKTKIKQTFGIAVPHWTDSLRECLHNMDII
ncbi:MAG: dTDP-4-dehydrorhamnose reductase [Bacteroidales bacterium]|nr:dTDP-4-dehydrorhamnose reductase [Bacteroidales bacterium]